MGDIGAELAQLQTWMKISALIYALGLLNFMFAQNMLLENLNRTSELLFRDRYPLIPLSTEKFWVTLTNSMMVMLIVICVMVAMDPAGNLNMVIVILFSKIVSSGQYIYLYFKREKYFAYMVGALTDGSLWLVTLFFYIKAL